MKIPDAKAAVDKESKKLEAIQPGSWKSQKWKGVILEAQRDKRKVHFAILMDIGYFEECGIRTEISEVQRSSRCCIY